MTSIRGSTVFLVRQTYKCLSLCRTQFLLQFCDALLETCQLQKLLLCGHFFTYYITSFIISDILFIFKNNILLTLQSYFHVKFFISHLLHIPVIDLRRVYFIMVSYGYFISCNPLSCGSFNMDIFYLHITYGRIFFISSEKDQLFHCVWIKHIFPTFSGDRGRARHFLF